MPNPICKHPVCAPRTIALYSSVAIENVTSGSCLRIGRGAEFECIKVAAGRTITWGSARDVKCLGDLLSRAERSGLEPRSSMPLKII